jgi:hypothetical protein
LISLSVSLPKGGRSGVPRPTLERAPGASRRAGMDRANGLVIAAHDSFVRLMFSGRAFPSQPATPSCQRAEISIHCLCASVQDVERNQQFPRDSSPCLKAGAFSLALVTDGLVEPWPDSRRRDRGPRQAARSGGGPRLPGDTGAAIMAPWGSSGPRRSPYAPTAMRATATVLITLPEVDF